MHRPHPTRPELVIVAQCDAGVYMMRRSVFESRGCQVGLGRGTGFNSPWLEAR